MLRDSAIGCRPARSAQEDARAKKPIRQTSIRGRSACLSLNLLLQKYRQDATICTILILVDRFGYYP